MKRNLFAGRPRSGGLSLSVFTDAEMDDIHLGSLEILERTGMWVEADTNITGGESLIRQFIHGKRFYKQEFDVDSELMWLPDVFGYSAALPQIMGSVDTPGNAKGVDAVPLDNEGLLVTFDGNRIGAPLPAGWYLDDVTVIADTLHNLIKENFETGGPGWSHGGSGDDWQMGVPESPIGPTAANSGQKCAGTNLRGSYEQLAD